MEDREGRMQRKASRWELSVKALKLGTGATLVVAAGLLLVFSLVHLYNDVRTGNVTASFERFISDVLLVIILLEIAKTLFTYVENEEMYLHSIMEAAFIAVLRQVILEEVNGPTWADTIGLAVLVVAMGLVYYRLYAANPN